MSVSCYNLVKEFHEVFGHPINTSIDVSDEKKKEILEVRNKFIIEEYHELIDALNKFDYIEV